MTIFVAMLLALAPPTTPSIAPPDKAQAPADAASVAAAMRLSAILYSEQSQIVGGYRLIDQSLIPAFRAQKEFQELEQEYPGLLGKLALDLRPVMERSIRRDLLAYHQRIAELLIARFSKLELEELATFYSGPTGTRLIAALMNNMTGDAMVKEAMSKPDTPVGFDAFQKDHKAAVAGVVKSIGKEDEAALLALASKPYFMRLATIGPAVRKIEQEFANQSDPELDADLEATITASIAQHIASAEKGKGAK